MDIVIRATIVFFILWILLRVLGRRELSELTGGGAASQPRVR